MFQPHANRHESRSMMKFSKLIALVVVLLSTMPFLAHGQGNKKLMTVKAAKTDAQRGILESIAGLKIRSETEVQDMVQIRFDIDAQTSGLVKNIKFTDIVYDPQKDIAKVVAQIKVGKVKDVNGRLIDYGDIVVERVGFGTSTPSNAGPLRALRAAQIHAYQQLAEQIVGLQIDSHTKVEDFILKSDDIKAQVLAAVWGAKIVDFSWDSNDDATVKISIKPNYIRDVMGQVFVGEHPEIIAEGMGTSNDTFSTSPPKATSNGPVIKEGSF